MGPGVLAVQLNRQRRGAFGNGCCLRQIGPSEMYADMWLAASTDNA